MSILASKHEIPDVAEAFGIPTATLHSWRRRGYLVGHQVDGVRGKRVDVSFVDFMQIGTGATFIATGVPQERDAFVAAAHFAYASDGALPNPPGQPKRPGRLPGLPFHHDHGRTLVHFAATTGETWESTPELDSWVSVAGHLGNPGGWVTVDASQVFAKVCRFLGLDPRVVLDEEYKEGSP